MIKNSQKIGLSILLFIILILFNYLKYKTIDFFSQKKILVIENKTYDSHIEILESVIVKNDEIIKKKVDFDYIYLFINVKDKSFIKYITNKYDNIKIINSLHNIEYDYYINASIYPHNKEKFKTFENGFGQPKYLDLNELKKPNHFYISHRISDLFNSYKNVIYITPLNNNNFFLADKLPFTNLKKKSNIPVFVIIGRASLRNNKLLEDTLNSLNDYDKKFQVKYLSRNNPNLKNTKNVKICENYNFEQFHKEMLDVHCIITLISEQEQPNYYKNQLTSTINYIYAYKCKALTDNKLKEIYNLPSKDCYIYNNKSGSFNKQFKQVIDDFYKN